MSLTETGTHQFGPMTHQRLFFPRPLIASITLCYAQHLVGTQVQMGSRPCLTKRTESLPIPTK